MDPIEPFIALYGVADVNGYVTVNTRQHPGPWGSIPQPSSGLSADRQLIYIRLPIESGMCALHNWSGHRLAVRRLSRQVPR